MEIFYYANDNLLELSGLQNTGTGAYINDATVTGTLKDSAGVELTGALWPLTLAYVTDSDGVYRATLPSTVGASLGDVITAEVSASGGGLTAFWSVGARVLNRAFDL